MKFTRVHRALIHEKNQQAMDYIINSIMKKVHNYQNNLLKLCILTIYYIYTPANKVWGVYRNHPVRPSISPSMYLVSATPPNRLIGFL